MGAKAIKITLWVMLSCTLLTWIVSLIGIAGLQRQCWVTQTIGESITGALDLSPFGSGLPHTGIRGFNRSYGCDRIYSYYWFMLAFEFVALVGLAVMAGCGLLAASALSWMAWLAVLSLLFIQGSDSFLALKDISVGLGGKSIPYARLTSAGWLMTALLNLGLIFLLGWRPRRVVSAAGGGPMKY